MQTVTAHQAKSRFGQLLDIARTEPVTIEKHGRPVAVLVSKQEFDDIQTMKLERLRAEVQRGIDSIESGEFTRHDEAGLGQLASQIKSEGRERRGST